MLAAMEKDGMNKKETKLLLTTQDIKDIRRQEKSDQFLRDIKLKQKAM